MYSVRTDKFEGPLELLLDLIEKQKLSISEISLAAIADEYISEIKQRAVFQPDEVAQFLVVASTLMLIKSRSLLPQFQVTHEEEADIEELAKRLQDLRRMRGLAVFVEEVYQKERRMYAREAAFTFPVVFYPPDDFTSNSLWALMSGIVEKLPHNIRLPKLPEHALKKIVSLEEKIRELMSRVEHSMRKSFRALVGATNEKTEIIVSFLALLELIKQGRVIGEQQTVFGDITVMHS